MNMKRKYKRIKNRKNKFKIKKLCNRIKDIEEETSFDIINRIQNPSLLYSYSLGEISKIFKIFEDTIKNL